MAEDQGRRAMGADAQLRGIADVGQRTKVAGGFHPRLLRAGWPDERDPDPEWLKAHLARLRSKLEAAGAPIPANVRGVGYKLGGPGA